jgi:thioredoxin
VKGYKRAARSLILTSLAISLAILLTPRTNRTHQSTHVGHVHELHSSDSFEKEVLQHSGPVVVDFYAPWCGACTHMMPKFAQAAKELRPHKIKFVKINVDNFKDLSSSLSIEALPTFQCFQNGAPLGTPLIGGKELESFKEWVLATCKS